jgi:hypothetical protein
MELDSLTPFSQEPVTGAYPDSDEFSPEPIF